MIVGGEHHGSYVLADPRVDDAGNLTLRVGAKRRLLGLDRPGAWSEVATIVLTPDEQVALWREMRVAHLDHAWEATP